MRRGIPYWKVPGRFSNPVVHAKADGGKTTQGLTASELFCPNCNTAMPVRERLLLVLPDGELHEYLCVRCGSSLGERTTRQERLGNIILPS